MKKIIALLSIVLFISCGSAFRLSNPFVKNLNKFSDARVNERTNRKADLKAIDLDNYTFYRLTKYFSVNGSVLYKGPSPIFNGEPNTRYEMLFMAIENTAAAERNVIYFSYIPPFMFYRDIYYNNPLFADDNFISLGYINYMQFGKLNANGELRFAKEESNSLWRISFPNANEVQVDNVAFLDRGHYKNVRTSDYLGNPAAYYKLTSPQFLYHKKVNDPVDAAHSNYLKDNILHYDINENEVYFEFTSPLKYNDGSNFTWISYSNRVRANYIP